MFEIEIKQKKSMDVIDSKLLHKKLEVGSYHSDWMRRRIDNYQFEEGKDYFIENSKKSKQKGRGGDRRGKVYLITLDMCKELAMLENNDIGKSVRRYFIKAEKKLRKTEAIRLAGIQVRKSLTDAVQESGEQERMHGHAYSQYTKMVYSICGLTQEYSKFKIRQQSRDVDNTTFRDFIEPEQLKRIDQAEAFIKPLLEMDKQYAEIKDILKPLFEVKEITE